MASGSQDTTHVNVNEHAANVSMANPQINQARPYGNEHATDVPMANPQVNKARTQLPSDVVRPTRTNTEPQQAATQPGDGGEVRSGQPATNVNVVQIPSEPEKIPFKEQVLGVAKKTRGTVLNKPELKEEGEMILEGQKSARDEKYSQ